MFIYNLLNDAFSNSNYTAWNEGRGSIVGVATSYGLDGPGIESRPGLSAPFQIGCGSYKMGTGVKRLRRGVGHPLPSRADVEPKVELFL
jgi:hypothetical protein